MANAEAEGYVVEESFTEDDWTSKIEDGSGSLRFKIACGLAIGVVAALVTASVLVLLL